MADKPRLKDAPNGLVGGRIRSGRDLFSAMETSADRTHHHTAASVPVELAAQAARPETRSEQLVRMTPTPPRLNVQSAGAANSSGPLSPVIAAPLTPTSVSSSNLTGGGDYSPAGASTSSSSGQGMPSPRRRSMSDSSELIAPIARGQRGSFRGTSKAVENPGPLQRDVKQQELAAGSLSRATGAGLFATLRGRTPVPVRKEDDAANAAATVDAFGNANGPVLDKKKRGSKIFSRSNSGSSASSTTNNDASSSASEGSSSLDLEQKKRGSRIFSARSERRSPPPQRTRSPARNAVSSIDMKQAQQAQAQQHKEGFFGKLFHRKSQNKVNEDAALAPRKRRSMLAAKELDLREAQLAAAGFMQLPGTLLSRAKGEELDGKYMLPWKQFELQHEIGEGAYATVYLAHCTAQDGRKKEVALKELKLQGNEQNEDMTLECAAVADAVVDAGFPTVGEVIRVAGTLLQKPETYEAAHILVKNAFAEFKRDADLEDEACVSIVAVLEALAALPAPSRTHKAAGEGKGAPQRLMEDVMRESAVLSKLWHKNIVEFVGVCLELPHLAIAMQYCHKGPLSDLLTSDEVCITWELRVKWAKEIAEAMNYLHSLDPKIIHRDLKADNVLIDNNDTAYVTDFGLSKAKVLTMMNPVGAPSLAGRSRPAANLAIPQSRAKYRSFVEFSEIAGTPSYLAPELWRNESYTEMVDVYSFGLVLWEILAREAPYKDLDNEDLVVALRDKHLRPTIPDWTPEPYRIMMERCWDEVPAKRPNFDQNVKLLKVLLEKNVFQWPPPDNYSLVPEIQQQYLVTWEKSKEDKEAAMTLAEKKLLAAREQLKAMKGSTGGGTTPTLTRTVK